MYYRTIYASSAVGTLTATTLASILDVARRTNHQLGVTGLLIAHQGRFFQVLEGPQQAVKMLVARIAKDPRHNEFQVIAAGSAKQRSFPTWTMGFARPDELPRASRDSVQNIERLVPRDGEARGSDPEVRREVRSFLAGFKYLQLETGSATQMRPPAR